jgi:L-seryl-tRNA(Ser) seleniumtransferase
MTPLDDIGLTGEPTAGDAVRSGATLVTMSGDKLLGGPQAGIIVGTSDAVSRLRENPMLRALRVDKFTIAALEATLALYRDRGDAMREIPVLAMLSRPLDDLRGRANALRDRIGSNATVVESEASVGGGAFPSNRIPSVALSFGPKTNAQSLEKRLRLGATAVIGRIADGQLLLDLRTIQPDEDAMLLAAIRVALPA